MDNMSPTNIQYPIDGMNNNRSANTVPIGKKIFAAGMNGTIIRHVDSKREVLQVRIQ